MAYVVATSCSAGTAGEPAVDGRPDPQGAGEGTETGSTDEGGSAAAPSELDASPPRLRFRDRAVELGIDLEQGSDSLPEACRIPVITLILDPALDCNLRRSAGGAAIADFDGDGFSDIFVPRMGGADALYRNLGGERFVEVAAEWGVDHPGQHNAAAFADLDEDGDLDLVVTGQGVDAHMIYERRSSGFVPHEGPWRMAFNPTDGVGGTSVLPGDVDGDGRTDLLFMEWARPEHKAAAAQWNLRLLGNTGGPEGMAFEDRTATSGLDLLTSAPTPNFSFSGSFSDFNADGHLDLFLTADFGQTRFFAGSPQGFSEIVAPALEKIAYGMGSAVADVDGDGDLDVFVTSISADPDFPIEVDLGFPFDVNHLLLNDGNAGFTLASGDDGAFDCGYGWGVVAADLDYDGLIDLASTNGYQHSDPLLDMSYRSDRNCLWLQAADSEGLAFGRQGDGAGFGDRGQGRGLYTLDFDNDGDLDIFQTRNADTPRLWQNEGAERHSWLKVQPLSMSGAPDARDALVAVRKAPEDDWQLRPIGQSAQYLGHGQLLASFGFGDSSGPVAELRVCWQSSQRMVTLYDVDTRRKLDVDPTNPVAVEIEGPCMAAITAE